MDKIKLDFKNVSFCIIRCVLCIVLLASCGKDVHKDESGIAVTLTNTTDPITDVTAWVFGTDNILIAQYEFSSSQEVASTVIKLPDGEYKVVAATNLKDAFSHSSTVGTTTLENLLLTINAPSSSPAHSHYGAGAAKMEQGRINRAEITLSRSMAEMEFTVNSVPSEVVSAELQVLNSSKGYYPAIQLLHRDVAAVDFGTTTPQSGKVIFKNRRLMPVVAMPTRADEDIKTSLQMIFVYENGGRLTFDVETPMLQNGGVYTPIIEYSVLRPGIVVEINDINGWIELPAIEGEILNPNR